MTTTPAHTHADVLKHKFSTRTARVGVVGLGYVGLPLAVELARSGLRATGIDLDARKVAFLNAGESYIQDVPSSDVAALHANGLLEATADPSVIAELDSINICVPTPLRKTKDPDLSFVVSASEMIANHLRPGQLVVLESTTYPGTTDEVVRPILERKGLVAGEDFFLAFSPERVDPGNQHWNTRTVPKVVGGLTPTCTELACALYRGSIDTLVPVSSTRAAEMVKIHENTFRAVNIGLVNELALMCDRLGIDVWEVIGAAATKPFGFMPFYPGPGLGGHCIPIDPFYLSWKVKEFGFEARFIELAGHVNSAMPHHVVTKVADALNSHSKAIRGSRILILGVSYKRDVDDFRESPAIDIIGDLFDKGADVIYHDPFVPEIQAADWPIGRHMSSIRLSPDTLSSADCVVILTDHTVFPWDTVLTHSKLLVDTRNAVKAAAAHLFKLGAPSRSPSRDVSR